MKFSLTHSIHCVYTHRTKAVPLPHFKKKEGLYLNLVILPFLTGDQHSLIIQSLNTVNLEDGKN